MTTQWKQDRQKEVLGVVLAHPTGVTSSKIALETGIPYRKVIRDLITLRSQTLVTSNGELPKIWVPTPLPMEVDAGLKPVAPVPAEEPPASTEDRADTSKPVDVVDAVYDDPAVPTPRLDDIYEVLRQNPHGITPTSIAAETGFSEGEVCDYLVELHAKSFATSLHLWTLAGSGISGKLMSTQPMMSQVMFEAVRKLVAVFPDSAERDLLDPEQDRALVSLFKALDEYFACTECGSTGWRLTNESPYVTACPDCGRFENDEQARTACIAALQNVEP